MSFDRRVMLAAGCGFAGIGLAAAAASPAAAQSNGRTPRRVVPRAPERPSGADDTAGLQAAIDDAAATREPLLLGPGRFLVRGLELRAGVHIRGAGQATVLVQSGSAPVLKGSSVDAATLERFAVEGRGGLTADGQALIEVRRSRGISIRHVALTGSSASALMLERCSGIVSGCRISLASKAGIFSLDADDGLEISHNAISDIGNNGILVWRSAIGEDGTIVTMNRIERIAARDGGTGQNGNAINVFRAGGVLVTTNRISDCAFSAVRANSASNVQIIANNVTRVGEVALYAEFAFQGAVISTNLIDGGATGISVTNFDHGGRLAVIQGNLVRNLSLHTGPSDPGGYGISVEADAAVTGNTIEGAPSAGIQIGWGRFCRDVAATGNVIRNCAIGIAVAADAKAGPALVAANMISGAARGAIRTMDHSRPVGEDLASSPPASGRIRTIANVVA